MCLIGIARKASSKFPLVIAANRDELYARPTRPAHVWEDDARIVGGDEIVHASNSGPLGTVDGVFAISNAPPGSEWEKVTVARDFLAGAVAQADDADALANSLLHFLSQKRGGPIEREILVASETYGTRSSTVIVADAFGDFLLAEQNYGSRGERDGEPRRYRLPFMT